MCVGQFFRRLALFVQVARKNCQKKEAFFLILFSILTDTKNAASNSLAALSLISKAALCRDWLFALQTYTEKIIAVEGFYLNEKGCLTASLILTWPLHLACLWSTLVQR